jgi:glycolate oxidase FAD binding subunit
VTDPMPPELTAACAGIRPAGPADAVSGRQARFVAEPAGTTEAAALMRAAAALGLTVVPRGSGSRLAWGLAPRRCDLIVDTRRMNGVLEHAAGDLVVRVQAGLTLNALQDKLAAEGQRLALDPPGGGTIGGLIATGVAGPLRFRYGSARDLLIGLTIVRADGTVAKAGGKVVKNVAGYDLGKLFAGSYGTLGLITEATFRLHPLPAASEYVTLDCQDVAAAAGTVQTAAASPLAPAAIELDWPAAAAALRVSVLLEGDEASVAERAGRMLGLLGPLGQRGTAASRPAQRKRADRDLGHPAQPAGWTYITVGYWAGQLTSVLGVIRTAAAEQALDPAVHGSAAGVLDVSLSRESSASAVAGFVGALRAGLGGLADDAGPPSTASAVVLDAPPAVRDAVDMWGPVPSPGLMRAIKDQFDPEHRMAPGRFAGGI